MNSGVHRAAPLLMMAALAWSCSEDGSSGWDTATDTVVDTAADSLVADTAGDTGADSTADTEADTAADTATDTVTDTATDPGADSTSGGDGCFARTTPGCSGCPCESCVCEIEPHCCDLFWDEFCVWDCEHICGFTC